MLLGALGGLSRWRRKVALTYSLFSRVFSGLSERSFYVREIIKMHKCFSLLFLRVFSVLSDKSFLFSPPPWKFVNKLKYRY
jgi:hypothetical protein